MSNIKHFSVDESLLTEKQKKQIQKIIKKAGVTADANKVINKLTIVRDDLINEIERKERVLNEYRIKRFVNFAEDECWIWSPDSANFIDSLVCPIVIHKEDLLRIAKSGFNDLENKEDD